MNIIKDLGIQITNSGHKKRFVLAKCDCGNLKRVALNAIKSGNTKSCGCQCHRKTPVASFKEYFVLQDMKKRCYATYSEYYYLYGGRGIKICDEWLNDPRVFIDWCKKNGYKKGLYIDRINPNGNYEPSNCRFVDSFINASNTRLLSKNNSSGYRGVSRHLSHGKKYWRARISVRNKIMSLGLFKTKKAAAMAYDNYVINKNLPHPTNTKKKTD